MIKIAVDALGGDRAPEEVVAGSLEAACDEIQPILFGPAGLDPKGLELVETTQAIAMGDGANDLPMMGEAGLSVAYHAKPKVREQAMVAIDDGGLDRLLEVVR